jgi:superoxide dismutase
MKAYLDESLIDKVANVDFSPLFNKETHALHIQLHREMLAEVVSMCENDEEMLEDDFIDEQKTAGFYDPAQRRAFAGHFNHMLLWSVLNTEETKTQEPEGAVSFCFNLLIFYSLMIKFASNTLVLMISNLHL